MAVTVLTDTALRHPVLMQCMEAVEQRQALYKACPSEHTRYGLIQAQQRSRSVLRQLLA